jgi:hypothetical protein
VKSTFCLLLSILDGGVNECVVFFFRLQYAVCMQMNGKAMVPDYNRTPCGPLLLEVVRLRNGPVHAFWYKAALMLRARATIEWLHRKPLLLRHVSVFVEIIYCFGHLADSILVSHR